MRPFQPQRKDPMSATHTDPILVSPPAQVSALLTQIAARMFDNVCAGGEWWLLDDVAFNAWKFIREVAHLYGTHGVQVMAIDFEAKFVDAVCLAHRTFHRSTDARLFPGGCDCEMAKWIHQLAPLMLRARLVDGK